MLGCKARNVGHTVGHLSANRIETAKNSLITDVRLDVFDDSMKLVQTLCRLRVEVNIAFKIKLMHLVEMLYHNGFTTCLPHKSQHFGVSVLSKDNDLCVGIGIELLFNALL